MKIKKWRKIISLFVLSIVITTSLPVEIFAESVVDRISESSKDASETKESEEQNKNSNQVNDKHSVTDADNKDFIGPIKTGESQNANDGPNVEVREVPEDMKQFFIGEKDLHSLGSYLEQEELAKQSDEWDALKAEKFSRSTGYRLSENGRLTANVARYTPTGLWYDHDIIIRWQLDGEDVFCIEEGVFTQEGINYEHRTDLSSIVGNKAMRLSMIGYFGYYTQINMQNYALTQMMIWDEMGGSFINYGTFGRSTYETHRDAINQKISEHNLNPSWHNTKITLKVGEEVRISDTHNRFSSWAGNVLVNTAGVNVRRDGNDIILTATASSNESGQIGLTKYNPEGPGIGTTFAYPHGEAQNLAKLYLEDPRIALLNIEVLKEGHARVRKVDETTGEALAGAVFLFTTSDNQSREFTTNAQGIAEWRDLMHDTEVTMEEIKAPTGYVLNKTPQKITIRANETTTATFDNRAQLGTITIDKSGVEFDKDMPNGNYTLAGNVFEIYEGTDTNGNLVDTITTDANGIAKSRNLPLGTYTVKEIEASEGFVLNTDTWTVEIEYAGQTVEITNVDQAIENKEQKGNVVLKKRDKETNDVPQGEATFEGAKFDLFRTSDDEKLGTYTTDASGELTVRDLLLDNYYFVEVEAPEGYVLDDTPVPFTIAYAGQTAEVAVEANATKENQVITGGFDLIKIGNYSWWNNAWNWITGKDESDQPLVLEGVEFTVYQDFGNKEEVARKVTDATGHVKFDGLPYGTYRVSETKVPTGYHGIKDFYVTITEHGQTFHYVIENKVKEAKVRFVKVDEKTGKEIVRSKAGFEIYSETTGEQLKMKDFEGVEHSVFYTNEEGILQLPTQFAFGEYKAVEVEAPEGYVLADEPAYFEVTGEEEDGIVLVVITNKNQMGQLEVNKTVETNVSISTQESEHGEYSQFDFEQHAGVGFEFKIRPTEDIVTGDNTVRYPANEFLQEDGEDLIWTTDEEGRFVTDPILYIGSYELVEVGAPKGVVLLEDPIPFEIEYAGQALEITSSNLEVENFLQDINIYGQKDQEVVVDWAEGQAVIDVEAANNGQVFALRLAEELTIGDTVLEADTTLAYTVVEEGVIAFEGLKLPNQTIQMYLQEVNAGSDHVLNEAKYFFTYEPETNEQTHDIHVSAKQTEMEGSEEDPEQPNEEEAAEEDENTEETDVEADQENENESEDPEADADGSEEQDNDSNETGEAEQEDAEEESDAILNKLARANVKVIKTDDMDQKALQGVEFDLIRIGEFKQIDSDPEDETTEGEEEQAPEEDGAEESEVETPEAPETLSEGAEEPDETPGDKDAEEEEPTLEDDTQTVIGTYVTDENGEIAIEDLPTGQYVLVETKPLEWYHENDEEYAFEISAENNGETIIIEVENNRLDLEIETLFAETETGAKVVDPTVDNKLTDYAWVKGGKEGHEYFVVTQYINVKTEEVVDTAISSFISTGEEEQELLFDVMIPANTMKDGDELVATHMKYSDEELTDLVSDHFDLQNKKQTVTFEKPAEEAPAIPQAGSVTTWTWIQETFSKLFK
ncbi:MULTISPECIES: SpaA isopeptide-forming pilin-related protein [unclassified Enterococcus]|uniref:SpaA isopeptide-forming pilin-related protein n=1 Tax=unclassified Enterococcus TaxID=2608891 RepID=UPI001902E478|nr:MULTISPECIES: SpaA isopeptide-forming pilin-related protein [unclassified Enterococcus]MBK0039324.1 Cys-Gln thioester bond-forming surface protein [Enterococcus sp. S52]MBK0071991.1 Cys-Gln thioester bond-forming surface protein [Enterococcus sp. S53]MBK0142582.1 Cys-Gln thioester bond-forming surface protein [Enterococcus sp. S76]MBK0146150.1 Cys-Gln thioester bond-forming surface protein [Enterococcus sp. S77]